jgi:hypothetical protein
MATPPTIKPGVSTGTITPASPPPATPGGVGNFFKGLIGGAAAGLNASPQSNKMTYQQFGDSIKAKYPQYADQNSAVLAQHVLAKYPQYQSQVTPLHDYSQGLISGALGQVNQAKLNAPAYSMGPTNKSGPVGTIAKETANIGKSLGKFAVGVGEFLDPTGTENKLAQLPETVGGYLSGNVGAAKAEAQATQMEQKAQAVRPGFKPVAQNTPPSTPNYIGAAAETILPPAAQLAGKGQITNAIQSVAEDPYQLAPAFLALKGVLDETDLGKTDTGKAVDTGISKIASPVTKAGEYIGGKIGDFAKTIAKFGTSQATGLNPKTISTILENPEKFLGKDYATDFTRENLGAKVSSAIKSRLSALSETGKEYQNIRSSDETVDVPMATSGIPAPVQAMLDKFGITLGEDKDGNPTIETSAESVPMSKADISALQDFIDKFGDKDELTANAFLNARKALSNMASYDAAKTDAADAMARELRAQYDKLGKTQLTGLEELDNKFSPETKLLQQIKRDYLNPDGTFKDNAISKLANLTNVGKESVLARLEQIVPGISKEITVLKAVEDIANAGGQKVGTYSRAAASAGGTVAALATGNIPLLIGAVTESILANPKIATQILAGWGKIMGVDVSGALNKVFNTGISPKGEGEIPSTTTLKGLAQDAKDNGGITLDFNGNKVTEGYAFSMLDKADESRLTIDDNFDRIFIDKFNELKEKYGSNPNAHMGGWTDNGQFVVDVSNVSKDLTQSLYDAILKKQDAIGDLAKYAKGEDGTIYISKAYIDSLKPLGRGSFESSQSPFKDWQEAVDYYTGKDFKNAQDIQSPNQQAGGPPVQQQQPQGASAKPGVAGSQAQNPPVGDVSGGRLLPSVENQTEPENNAGASSESDTGGLVQRQQYDTGYQGLGKTDYPVPTRNEYDTYASDINYELEKAYNQSHIDNKISKDTVGSYLDNITPTLKASGLPDATLKNIREVFTALPNSVLGKYEGLRIEPSPGVVGALSLRVGGYWGLELNRAYYDSSLYTDGSIINHELGGHLTYAKAPNTVKSAINDSVLQLADTDPKSIEEIWGQNLSEGPKGTIANMRSYYTSEIQRVYNMLQRSKLDGETILNDAGLTEPDGTGTALPPKTIQKLMSGAKQVVYDYMKSEMSEELKGNEQIQEYFKNGNHMMADEFRARLMEQANNPEFWSRVPQEVRDSIMSSPLGQDLENIKNNFQGILKKVTRSKNFSAAKLFAKSPPAQ